MLLKWLVFFSVVGAVVSEKMVGYYASWANYRTGVWDFPPEKIDENLYTHLIYAYAMLDPDTYTIRMHDPMIDVSMGGYADFVAIRNRNPDIKLLIAIGGAVDSSEDKYSVMAASPELTSAFVDSVVQYLDTYGFDGLGFDWQYQKAEDIVGYVNVIKALRAAFGTKYELTVGVTGSVDPGYDVPAINAHVDAIHLMTYDYHGAWGRWGFIVDHHAPLYRRPTEPDVSLNADYTVNYWISQGASPSKLVLGIPTYGRSWVLSDPEHPYPPTVGTGAGEGPITRQNGILAYFEVCSKIQADGWTVVQDSDMSIGPFAYLASDWVGYDDPAMAAHKTNYALGKGLGGVFVWDNSNDDFNNVCGEGVNPIQSAIVQALNRTSTSTSTTTLASTSITTPNFFTETTTDSTTVSSTTEGAEFVCPSDGLFPSPTRCDAYYSCRWGVAILMHCPEPLYFNPILDACDFPANVDCQQ